MLETETNSVHQSKLRDLLTLFLTFLKLGAFTFGGGYAMISLLRENVVEKKKVA